MSKLFWHELRDSTIKRLIKNKVTWGEIIRRYRQPVWCGYLQALNGMFGCWALIDLRGLRHKISQEYCSRCECFIKVRK